MAKKTESSSSTPLPLARTWRLKELPGWLGKNIEIPAGRTGVALHPDGTVRTFPPGKQRLLSALERLRGKGIGLLTGYVPNEALTVRFRAEALLSGDGELLDGTLICGLAVADAGRFFREVVLPQGGEIREGGIDLDAQLLEGALGGLTNQYAAADLVSGRLGGRLGAGLQSVLEAVLSNQGMRLEEIRLLSLTRAENRAVIAEKAQKLAERLQEVELQKKMAAIETQAQLDEFMRQVDPELAALTQPAIASQEPAAIEKIPSGNLLETVKNWLKAASKQTGEKRHWRIAKLFQGKQEAEQKTKLPRYHRPDRSWWLGPALGMGTWVTIGVILTVIINLVFEAASWDNRAEVILIVWTPVLAIFLASLKKLYEKFQKHEEDAANAWPFPGTQHIDRLVGNDREWADELVRDQCARELLHVKEVISEVRSREYKRGKTEVALKLKNELERNAEECANKIKKADYGRPPYVTDLNVSQHAWEGMLDIDENLLIQAKGLSDKAHLLQERSQKDEMDLVQVTELEAEISKFGQQFFERGRPLQVPVPEEKSAKA